jgi:predicted nuclease of predicted toxin-antitoxin system
VRFLADVNVSRRVVALLREKGLDVVRVSEILDPRTADPVILEEARSRDAVVISHDQDFTALLALSGATSPSLINLRVSYADSERLADEIAAVARSAARALAEGAIATVDDGGARVLPLPVE